MPFNPELWKSQRAQKKRDRLRRMETVEHQFAQAQSEASDAGMLLIKCSDARCQLRTNTYVLDIFPSNLTFNLSSGTMPKLDLPDEWDLLDVVRLAKSHSKEGKPK